MNTKKMNEQTGISADTIRYYGRTGLLPRVTHNKSGIRGSSECDITTLEFVRCFRKAGMSIEPLIEYMTLVKEGNGTEKAHITLLEEQRDKLAERIAELRSVYDRLNYKIESYQNIILKKEQVLSEDGENE